MKQVLEKLRKKIYSVVIRAIIAFVVILSTTYGWGNEEISQQSINLESNLKNIVTELSEKIGSRNFDEYENLEKAALFIIKQFHLLGYQVDVMEYEISGKIFKNIIAENPNSENTDEIFIVGAHYDSCFNPGADDNASGIAGLLELARLFKEEKLNRKLRFVAFVNEEPPFFMTDNMGSRVYTREVKKNKENIKGAIILEMIGYYSDEKNSQRYPPLVGPFFPNKGNYVAVVSNLKSKSLLKQVVKGFKDSSDFPIESITVPGFIPGFNFSDHWSFWKEKYPAVMVTDTAFHRNGNYHKETDLPDTLDYPKMAEVVLGLKSSITLVVNQQKGKVK